MVIEDEALAVVCGLVKKSAILAFDKGEGLEQGL